MQYTLLNLYRSEIAEILGVAQVRITNILPSLNDCFESLTLLSSAPGREMIKVSQLAPVSPTLFLSPVEYSFCLKPIQMPIFLV